MYSPLIDILFGDFIISKKIHLWNFYCYRTHVNLCLEGNGLVVLNSPCSKDELYEIVLQNDVVKIDGNHAVCWSKSLEFTVEKSGKSLIGSVASGESLVNVYRGTGKILMSPLC